MIKAWVATRNGSFGALPRSAGPVGCDLSWPGSAAERYAAPVSENDDAILAAIQAAFDQVLPEARRTLSPSDELVDLGVGSVAALEMAGQLEDQFEVRFPEGDLYTLRTVGDFVGLVRRSLGTRI